MHRKEASQAASKTNYLPSMMVLWGKLLPLMPKWMEQLTWSNHQNLITAIAPVNPAVFPQE